jgi:glyoxylase-like metal-dependent hydrolase (beta-lactamase superfamily II)
MVKRLSRLIVGPISTNCWIYPVDSRHAVVIDPGADANTIVSTLDKHSLIPAYIVLTHGHFDHIAALPLVVRAYSSTKPKIVIHKLDSIYLGSGAYEAHAKSFSAATGDTSFIDEYWNDMPDADIFPEEGDMIGPFTVLHLPGHSPGSIGLWNRETGILFSGDTLFAGDYGRIDLPGGNEDEMIGSLHRLFKMDPETGVYPGHGPVTTIGREAERGIV